MPPRGAAALAAVAALGAAGAPPAQRRRVDGAGAGNEPGGA